jgi:hypothetical protein
MHSMTESEWEMYLKNYRIRWKHLQEFVTLLKLAKMSIFDPVTLTKRSIIGKTNWEYSYQQIGQITRACFLLRIPLHYTINNEVYIVREECSHILYTETQEDQLEEVNKLYLKYKSYKRQSLAKQSAYDDFFRAADVMAQQGTRIVETKDEKQPWNFENYDNGQWLEKI